MNGTWLLVVVLLDYWFGVWREKAVICSLLEGIKKAVLHDAQKVRLELP